MRSILRELYNIQFVLDEALQRFTNESDPATTASIQTTLFTVKSQMVLYIDYLADHSGQME